MENRFNLSGSNTASYHRTINAIENENMKMLNPIRFVTHALITFSRQLVAFIFEITSNGGLFDLIDSLNFDKIASLVKTRDKSCLRHLYPVKMKLFSRFDKSY